MRNRNRTLSPEEIERIVIAYERGDRLKDIAAQFGVTWARISEIGRTMAEHPRPIGRPPRIDTEAEIRLVVASYLSGMSIPRIEESTGLSGNRIERILHGRVEMRRSHKRRNPIRDAAVADYVAGMDSVAVGIKYGVEDRTIGRWVVGDGHQMRPRFGGKEGILRGAHTRKSGA